MMPLPITLVGENLGKRHRYLNKLVNDAYQQKLDFNSIKDRPEKSPLDRLFKIDLASKHKDVDYVIQNLKEQDMLFVSRALKNVSIEDLKDILDPSYLEDDLYPDMTTTAVNKMKHWIENNLIKESRKCEEFYLYYVDKKIETALKFLYHCSNEFILKQVSNKDVLEKITSHRLKVLCEKCPEVASIFYNAVENNEKVYQNYLQNPNQFYESIKVILKLNGDIFLDITEKYFNFRPFSDEATKHVIKHYKKRFQRKPELYTSQILDIKTLAKCLDQKEIKDLILTLARANYLDHWFKYKNVEPLIKALPVEERAAFKKRVFVDKDIGEEVKQCPYKFPSWPDVKIEEETIFDDEEHNPDEYDGWDDDCGFVEMRRGRPEHLRCITKKCARIMNCAMICKRKTSLDQLYDHYRYVGFDKAFYELRKKMTAESTKHRQNIMLVLISKSGGRTESLEQLLTLLTSRYENEAENLRATIIRSLVRRCSAWRLPENVWQMMLTFGRGVGLDGTPATVACKEGLHAVVIRSILKDSEIKPEVWKAYMNEFSNFNDYTLNKAEKLKISSKLPELLIASAKNDEKHAIDRVEKALDILEAYKVRVDRFDDFISIIADIAKKDENARTLLNRLYESRIARRKLFKENFALRQNNESYINALKHDISVLNSGESFEKLIKSNSICHDRFFQYLSLYFNEDGGLASIYFSILMKSADVFPKEEPLKKNLARSIAILSGSKIIEVLHQFDDLEKSKRTEKKRFSSALKANAHLARPRLDIKTAARLNIGTKVIANTVLTCSTNDIDKNLGKMLSSYRTLKLALILSTRIGKEIEVLSIIGKRRPQQALKTILRHAQQNKLEEKVWDVIISLIGNLNKSGKVNERLRKMLSKVDIVPVSKKAKYCTVVYEVFRELSKYATMPMLCNIENILKQVDSVFIENILKEFITKGFTKKDDSDMNYDRCIFLHTRIIAKYLMLCKSENEQDEKWKNIGEPFFDKLEAIWNESVSKYEVLENIKVFSWSCKYSKVFLDSKYVSCLPMFEKIIQRLQKFILLHENFKVYIHFHLTMLFFKSVRQSMHNNPDVFENLPKNKVKATEIVGRIFGKYVAHEIIILAEKYFDSIREFYKEDLIKYLDEYFGFLGTDSREIFITNFVRGIMGSDKAKALLLAEHIFNAQSYSWAEKHRDEILEELKQKDNLELKFYLYSHMNKIF